MQDITNPRTLASIAEDAAFSMSDVAFISGLEESTIYRLWDKPDWLDKVSGRSLQALIATVPELGDYVAHYSMRSRRQKLIQDLATEGLRADEAAIDQCICSGVPEQYLSAALQAAIHIMRGDNAKASSYLARFWGKGQDRALTALFSPGVPNGLLKNPDILVNASAEIASNIGSKRYSFHAIITQAVFGHYIGKAVDQTEINKASGIIDRQSAFTFRSTVTGLLINTNDGDLAERYHRVVASKPVLRTVEDWAFPTFTRDSRPNSDFTLPRSLLLRNTAEEVVAEISCNDYGDAYVSYLIRTYLPIALERDPTFGLHAVELRSALLNRRDRSDDAKLRQLYDTFAKKLHGIKH